MASAFVAAAATWWIYFDHGERIGSEAIEASDEPGRLARTAYTWIHLLIIAGLVLLSVGDKEALSHPHAQGFAVAVTVLGGPVLFLAGTILFRRVLGDGWPRAQVAGLAAFAALGAVALTTAAIEVLTLSVSATLILVAVAAAETAGRVRRGRRGGG
jgi:low temperature requirement protein LtrA